MKEGNFAFIDSQNLNLSIRDQGWKIDWKKFRLYLAEKYGVTKAFLFIGYVFENSNLYSFLHRSGYICIFKPVLDLNDGAVKGNIDAELVLHTMIQIDSFNKALIVSGDGDFYCLVEYLMSKDKLLKVLIPNQRRYSALFKKLSVADRNILDFLNLLKDKLEYKK